MLNLRQNIILAKTLLFIRLVLVKKRPMIINWKLPAKASSHSFLKSTFYENRARPNHPNVTAQPWNLVMVSCLRSCLGKQKRKNNDVRDILGF